MNGNYSKKYKIILLGDSGVGKSSIINQYVKNEFINQLPATIGVEFQQKFMTINGEQVKLCIFDTSGQEKFQSISRQYYRNVDGVILVYDITKIQSLINIDRYWIQQLKENAANSYEMILIGNKTDLRNDFAQNHLVSTEMGQNYAKQYSSMFVETSAKTGENLKSALNEFFLRIHSSIKSIEHEEKSKLSEKSLKDIEDKDECC